MTSSSAAGAGGTAAAAAGGLSGAERAVRLGRADGRWVIAATVLGSGMAMLDGTVVNVALPAIGRRFSASLGGLQWTVTAYTLALAALILLGGSLGDRLGRRKVFLAGVAWFALASALCGLAPNIAVLIAARVLQGVGGALLVPGSLAIIQASFVPGDRAKAVGSWSGLGAIAAAIGPLLGGWIVVTIGWRWVFLLNLPLAAVVIAVSMRHVPESSDSEATGRFDVLGAVLAALALAGLTYALIEAPERHGLLTGPGPAALAGVLGVAAGVGFVLTERRRGRAVTAAAGAGPVAGGAGPGARAGGRHPPPMLPLDVFASRQFTAVNLVTFLVYGAFGGMLFLLVLDLQDGAGFSALRAGTTLLPVTILMLLLSPRSAALAQRVGPRWLMAAGTSVCACGVLLMARIGEHAGYLADVLPAVVVFGLGLSMTVAPLTATVLASADVRHAGVASGVNNAVARAAGLLAVAGLPAAVGLSAAAYHSAARLTSGFHAAVVICAVLLAAAAVLSALLIDDKVLVATPERVVSKPLARRNCPIGAPPLEAGETRSLAGNPRSG